MRVQPAAGWTRRAFLDGLTLTGMVGLLGVPRGRAAAEPPPETTTLRLVHNPGICTAPYFVAEELLAGEGFTQVHHVPMGAVLFIPALLAGEVDIVLNFVGPLLVRLDAGDPLVILAGGHVGCFELFGTDHVRAIRDLKGKTVAVPHLGSPAHVFLASMAAYVGLDAQKDITWVTHAPDESMQLFTEGKIDAFLGFPPHTRWNCGRSRSGTWWSTARWTAPGRNTSAAWCTREFARKYPVATKRALRAILKAADICALEPERAAGFLVDKGYTQNYSYALQTMKELPYGKWREYDPEDTVRFYALRLHEAGMIKNSPQKLIAQGTDWRFLNELRKELKG